MRQSLLPIQLATIAALLCTSDLQSQVVAYGSSSPDGEVATPRATARTVTAMKTSRAPVIDGRLDDEIWSSAMLIDGFRTFDPVEDGDPKFRTEARIAYDERNIYIAVRAFDAHPDSIVALLARRDVRSNSDEIKVMIDGYHDKRSGFAFVVNPAGVKRDIYIFNDTEEDLSWDGIWDVSTRIDSLGWTAEFRIPLSQIRYPKAESHTFGVMITREIGRYNERWSWPVFRRSQSGLASQFGTVDGITGLGSPRRLEISPYTVTKAHNTRSGERFIHKGEVTGGVDVKYGITSNLTLDATVNPDFGQVEADPSVLNLGTAETFYPEKRPFFLEGQGLFRFDINCNDGRCSGLFYSRRIGRAPQLGGVYPDDANAPASTILGATKLTGTLGNGVSVGVLHALTQGETGSEGRTIEPMTNYAVARVQRDMRGGGSGVGLMLTGVDRQNDAWTSAYLRDRAYAAGLDFRHQFAARKYQLSGYLAGSSVHGTEAAIARTQRSLVHNYQRPDDSIDYDPSATDMSGTSGQLVLEKRGGGKTRFSTGYQYISPGFEINDIGYLGRANQQSQFAWWQYAQRTPRAFYRQWIVNLNEWALWTTDGLRQEVGGNFNAHMQLKNNMWLRLGQGGNALVPSYSDNAARGGPALRMSPSGWGWATVEGDGRRRIVPSLSGNWGWGDEGNSSWWGVSPSVQVKVASRFTATVGASYSAQTDAAQWYANYGALGHDTTHYTFASLDQRTLALTTRLNFTATPTLSLQVYAQPFVSAGTYSDWKELDDPRAPKFSDRFKPYGAGEDLDGFNFKQFRSNAIVRWEYRPGSRLFVVWGQERTAFDSDLTNFSAGRDYRNLFRERPRNVLMIKGSYWLNM